MTDREVMQQALEALESLFNWQVDHERGKRCGDAVATLRAALEQPKREPLTDEDIEQAQRTVWRSLPSDFDYTTSSWIEIGIRYAEAAHGIGEKP